MKINGRKLSRVMAKSLRRSANENYFSLLMILE
jgi:hypothetical protein